MDPPPPPPFATPTSPNSHPPLPFTITTKLRLMCSYGGHIIPRPNKKSSLFYAGGETRIVALDRRTTASSLSALTSHLSRTLYNNRPFTLKYQLPNEDFDSLISVTADEDLFNMIEEHDRINQSSPMPSRIRLFLFPVKPESLESSLLDPKSESWFSDALKSTRILQKVESADTGLLMDLGFVGGSDLEAQMESGNNCGGGFESKHGAESLVLETSSSFGSTSSSISMSNLPPTGVLHCDENGLNLQDKKIRVQSSASVESDNSNGSAASYQLKTGMFQEPLIQVTSGTLSNLTESEGIISAVPSAIETQQTAQILGHSLSHQHYENQLQPDMQYIHGAVHYIPQYSTNPSPISPYYPVYQMPIHQQQQHIIYPPNQSYPVYLMPVRPTQYHNMSVQYNFVDDASSASSRPPLHPTQPVARREVLATQPVAESSTKACISGNVAAPPVSISSSQSQQLIGPPELQDSSESVTNPSEATMTHGNEFEDDIVYNSIYKTQPLAPLLPKYETLTKGASVLFSESSVQQQPAKHQPAMHNQ